MLESAKRGARAWLPAAKTELNIPGSAKLSSARKRMRKIITNEQRWPQYQLFSKWFSFVDLKLRNQRIYFFYKKINMHKIKFNLKKKLQKKIIKKNYKKNKIIKKL